MRWLLLIVISGTITGCTQPHRYNSVEEVCSLANYRNCTLVETIGDATAPFKHSNCMVMNRGVNKFIRYMQSGTGVKRDLSKYKEQEVVLVFLTDDRNDSLVLVMTPDQK